MAILALELDIAMWILFEYLLQMTKVTPQNQFINHPSVGSAKSTLNLKVALKRCEFGCGINSWIGFLFFGNCPTSKRWANPFTVTPTDRNQHPCRGDLVPMELRRRRFHLSLDGPTDTAGVGWGRHGYVLGGGTYNRYKYKSLQKSMESALYCRIH